jgi:hypothetical protein
MPVCWPRRRTALAPALSAAYGRVARGRNAFQAARASIASIVSKVAGC